ncbi:hypothetical protein GCM10009823_23760 [Brevibacterium salitolerans]|uniref:Uncharacterized protein n=1 Tax=Brevibacterium salitolerans TaxID=1403566 RepID=A0ABN2X049_9MICO
MSDTTLLSLPRATPPGAIEAKHTQQELTRRLSGRGISTTRSSTTHTATLHAVRDQNVGSGPCGAADLRNQND